ncbi:MAG: PspC domain-containing protein [Saprospiraceae bacterium]
MNKTFNINLGGFPFSIDEDAYSYISDYLSSIRRHFSTSEGCDEILYDIEVRMAELFQDALRGRTIIGMKEVDDVIAILGKPEDFGAEPLENTFTSYQGGSQTKYNDHIGVGKRLFRDPDDKKIAGVCSGISAYFGIADPIWIRLAFILLVVMGGVGVIPYILLWFLVPEASSSSDKLAMKGEPTTIQNIANLVEKEITELGEQINQWSQDIGNKKKVM